ncbi:unnamed protein product [Tenebrio molitor]|nr:unnamed protein product [Tenebrio molitor]
MHPRSLKKCEVSADLYWYLGEDNPNSSLARSSAGSCKWLSFSLRFGLIWISNLRLVFYLEIVCLEVLVCFFESMLSRYCADASKMLHDTMLNKVVYGDMTFFNHHSPGRILNRFAKDIGCIDEYSVSNSN